MKTEEFEHRLRNAVRSRPAPEPGETQMQAILSRREAGERVLLPVDSQHSVRAAVIRWVVVGTLAAAASLALATGLSSPRRAEPSESKATQSGFFGVEMLYAQATDHPTFPVIRAKRELPARSWRYGWMDEGSPVVDSSGTWRGERVAESFQSIPTYRYAYSTWGSLSDRVLSDTVWLDQERFLPIVRRAGTGAGEQIFQEFKENTVLTGRTTSTGYTQWTSEDYNTSYFKMAGDPKLRPAPRLGGLAIQVGTWRLQLLTGLEAAELGPNWRGSLEIISAPGGFWASRFWLNFQVVGEERVTIPAGEFDTWKVQVGEDIPFLLWVSKDGNKIVQVGTEGGKMREVLIQSEVK